MPVHRHTPRPREPLEVTDFQRMVRILHCTQGRLDFEMDCYPDSTMGSSYPTPRSAAPGQGWPMAGQMRSRYFAQPRYRC
jgi:hypothetical protein